MAIFLAVGIFLTTVSCKASGEIKSLRVSGLSIGMDYAAAIKHRGGLAQAKRPRKSLYEIVWPDGAGAVFRSDTNQIVEIYGFDLKDRGIYFARIGTSSDAILTRAKALKWPTPEIILPPTDTLVLRHLPLSEESQCVLRFRFDVGKVDFMLTDNKLEAVSASTLKQPSER